MSDLVARARAALDGVTPGEWKWVPIGNKSSVTDSDYDVLFRAQHNPNAYADARFIAAARSLVPDMADRIEALEKELAGGSFYQEKDIDAMQDEITRLRAEVDRLREAERTAWERGRDAAADAIDDELRRFKTWYSDSTAKEAANELASVIRAITPEASHD